MSNNTHDRLTQIYNRSTLNLIIFACLVIITSIVITGVVGHNTSKKAVVEKHKSSDLLYIIKSMGAQIDGTIQKAKETSILIADDPTIQAWFLSAEKNDEYKSLVMKRVTDFSATFSYSNIFMANDLTKSYWNNGILVDVLAEDDKDDEWYRQALASKRKINLNIDYNKELKGTFLWINTLMGDVDKPIGVAGIGMDLGELASEFEHYKVGKSSQLWLVGANGEISISEDIEERGTNIGDYIPGELKEEMLASLNSYLSEPSVREYTDQRGRMIDLIYQPLESCDWLLVFQIPRQEVVSILDSMRVNTIATVFITIFAIILVFYLISTRIANPYKKALEINKELEHVIEERTIELTDKTNKLLDSIDYAKKIQESILPTADELHNLFNEYFVIWKPRDNVGGDFYMVKRVEEGLITIVADCTGHGVPGAFMTMAANSILNNIITGMKTPDPSIMLAQLDKLLKEHLNKAQSNNRFTDDGLEAGICFIRNQQITFAGAGIDLYIKDSSGLSIVKGIRKGIGYRKTDLEKLSNYDIHIQKDSAFYMTTDGYLDQNGGDKDLSLGRNRFIEIINRVWMKPMPDQEKEFQGELQAYMEGQSQRDDITVFGFKA